MIYVRYATELAIMHTRGKIYQRCFHFLSTIYSSHNLFYQIWSTLHLCMCLWKASWFNWLFLCVRLCVLMDKYAPPEFCTVIKWSHKRIYDNIVLFICGLATSMNMRYLYALIVHKKCGLWRNRCIDYKDNTCKINVTNNKYDYLALSNDKQYNWHQF